MELVELDLCNRKAGLLGLPRSLAIPVVDIITPLQVTYQV